MTETLFTTAAGSLHPLVWVLAIMTAAFVIMFVWIILHFIWPMATSPGKHFVKARRDKKPVFILDDGPIYRIVIGHDKAEKNSEILRAGEGSDVIRKGPGSLKYCEGVLMGVGENFRSFLANLAIIDLIEIMNEKGWNVEEVKTRIEKLQDHLKKDLGLTDKFDDLKKEKAEAIDKLEKKLEAARAAIIEAHAVPDENKEGSDAEEKKED